MKVNDKINLDIFLGGGNAQSKYRSYYNAFPDIRADKKKELLLTEAENGFLIKVGVMISYQIK